MAGRHRTAASDRLGRWLAAAATAVVVVVLGGVVANTELSTDERFREFVVTGAMGEWVDSRAFDVNVAAVRAAATISAESAAGLDTAGVWLLVRVQVMADRESVWLDHATVRDSGGRGWEATARIDQPLVDSGYRLDPRIPVEGELAFEVPRDAATDLTLRLGEGTGSLFGLQMATVVEVPLRVDAAAVATGLAEPEPLQVESPKIVIADPQILQGVPEEEP